MSKEYLYVVPIIIYGCLGNDKHKLLISKSKEELLKEIQNYKIEHKSSYYNIGSIEKIDITNIVYIEY